MLDAIANDLRQRIVGTVRATVSGAADGSAVVKPSDDGYFAPGSIIRTVHGDVTTMMVGGVSALLLQMLHPAVLAGVWDHSNFRADMLGRLHRTARFIAVTTYASRNDADRAIERVRTIHGKVEGSLPDGTPYRAGDARLLAWVHVVEAISFFDAWRRYGRSKPTRADEADYFAAFALIAEKMGAAPIPRNRSEADALLLDFRPELRADARTREVCRLVTRPQSPTLSTLPAQALVIQSAIDLLPAWARRMHGLDASGLADPIVRAGTTGMAVALRWAFSPR